MPRSDMPWGQPKLSSTPSHSVSSTRARIDLEIAVGDEFDVVHRDQTAVRAMDRAVARARNINDRRSGLA